MSNEFTHFDPQGRARMVDVAEKPVTQRRAVASSTVSMQTETANAIRSGVMSKGDVLGIARLAGIMAAKKTADLIPLCHPVRLTSIQVHFDWLDQMTLQIIAIVEAQDRTGVEMEALTAVSIAGLTVYDMCKSNDRSMTISAIQLDEKSGGRHGFFSRKGGEN